MKTIFRYFFISSFVLTVFAGLIFCTEYEKANSRSSVFSSRAEVFRVAIDEIITNTSNDFATKAKLNPRRINLEAYDFYLPAQHITFYDSFFIPLFISKRILPLARNSLAP